MTSSKSTPRTLSLKEGNLRTALPDCIKNATLAGSIEDLEIRKLALPIEHLSSEIGPYLLEHNLYSQGNDFTSEDAKAPGHIGNSTMKALWKGEATQSDEQMAQADIYLLLRKRQPVGVVIWLSPDPITEQPFVKHPKNMRHHPKQQLAVARMGNLMAYLHPPLRGQGICRFVVKQLLLPQLVRRASEQHSLGRIPLVGAADGMHTLFTSLSDIPTTQHLSYCLAMTDDVWRMVERQKMNPERTFKESRWLVPARACPQKKPRLRA